MIPALFHACYKAGTLETLRDQDRTVLEAVNNPIEPKTFIASDMKKREKERERERLLLC